MRRMSRLVLILSAAMAGCGGQYILTAPQQVAPAGGQVRTVVRLQRREFLWLTPAVEEAPLSFTAADAPLRAAYTDSDGYAALNVPAPDEPGLYDLNVHHQDDYGQELSRSVPLFVWDRDVRIIAVDADCLPSPDDDPSAVRALQTLAQDAQILYMTETDIAEHDQLGRRLREKGYPQGPILLWQYRGWTVTQVSWRLPRIEFEDRWVHQLEVLREDFPHLRTGICCDEQSAGALTEAGLETILIGDADVDEQYYLRRSSWSDLAETGL